MANLPNTETKDKIKRKSKGERKHIRRMKQEKRRESILVVPKKN
jgi:hypothetical protein